MGQAFHKENTHEIVVSRWIHWETDSTARESCGVSSCGVEYEHTFAIVDFGKSSNYDIILGRPFMQQLKMIQDWGFNYIYLRQPQAVMRINLGNHSYRDVARTPVIHSHDKIF